jgi:hypothetical protein
MRRLCTEIDRPSLTSPESDLPIFDFFFTTSTERVLYPETLNFKPLTLNPKS